MRAMTPRMVVGPVDGPGEAGEASSGAMSPILVVLVLAVGVAYLLGGRLRNLERVRIHWWGLALMGVAMQFVPIPAVGDVEPRIMGAAVLMGSYVALLVFLTVNRWVPAARVMALGLLMNLVVVGTNGGMPVSARAIEIAGGSPITLLGDAGPKHHLMSEHDLLGWLGDVIPLPRPAGVVLSPGDLLLYGGMAWFVVQVMRERSRANPRPLAMWFPSYRGKHAPDHWRMPARYRSPDHATGARSGIEL